jgi:pilus assembly protein CpaB
MNLFQLFSKWPRKTWIVLGVALATGLLAALVARSWLANRMADLEYKARGGRLEQVVARQLLKRGERIAAEKVAVRKIPVEFAHASGIGPDEFSRVDNRVLGQDVQPGETILSSMLEAKKPPTFSAQIATGRRAITVPVDEVNSISGMLEPGDLIDLLVSLDQQGRKLTVPLMHSVVVMATGQRSLSDPKSGERRVYSTVTLDADPQQAQYLIVARETGRLTALLRNPDDRVSDRGNAVDLAALLGFGIAADGDTRQVPVLYGGRAGKIPPEGLRLGQYVGALGKQTQPGAGQFLPRQPGPPAVPGGPPRAASVYQWAQPSANLAAPPSADSAAYPSADEASGAQPPAAAAPTAPMDLQRPVVVPDAETPTGNPR